MKRVSVITPCFRSEAYLDGYFAAVLQQTALDELEVVLIMNEPSAEELAAVDRFDRARPGTVVYRIFPEGWSTKDASRRGPRSQALVSQSMNRAVAASHGIYIAHWDVDDVRTPGSIEAQMRTLDENPDALMTYGDMKIVRRYGDTEGELYVAPEFDRDLFMRACCGGTFRMWRKDALELVGPFDEQFRSGGDYDLYVRIAANGRMVKTPDVLLGYYLNAGSGLSTAGDGLQPTERTVVELRYGMLGKIDRRYLPGASRYRVGELRSDDRWIPVDDFVPDMEGLLARAAADPALLPRTSVKERLGEAMERNVCRVRKLLGLARSGTNGRRW